MNYKLPLSKSRVELAKKFIDFKKLNKDQYAKIIDLLRINKNKLTKKKLKKFMKQNIG